MKPAILRAFMLFREDGVWSNTPEPAAAPKPPKPPKPVEYPSSGEHAFYGAPATSSPAQTSNAQSTAQAQPSTSAKKFKGAVPVSQMGRSTQSETIAQKRATRLTQVQTDSTAKIKELTDKLKANPNDRALQQQITQLKQKSMRSDALKGRASARNKVVQLEEMIRKDPQNDELKKRLERAKQTLGERKGVSDVTRQASQATKQAQQAEQLAKQTAPNPPAVPAATSPTPGGGTAPTVTPNLDKMSEWWSGGGKATVKKFARPLAGMAGVAALGWGASQLYGSWKKRFQDRGGGRIATMNESFRSTDQVYRSLIR